MSRDRSDKDNASPRTRRMRTTAVALLVLAGCVNYFDRAAVAVGNPEIRAELGLSFSEMGLLLSAFAWSYGLAQIPAGVLVDRYGARRTLGVGMVLWSFAQLAGGAVHSLHQFLGARIALGLGESPMYIGGTRVCADWFPLKKRALPIAIFNSSSALAPALAPPILTMLMLAHGWRVMFIIAGLAGFVVAALWAIYYRAPRDADIPAADIEEIHRDDGAAIEHVGWSQVLWLLRFPTTWGMFLGFFGVVYVSWLYATWLPGYLEIARHQSIANAGIWSAVPLAAGFFGAVAGGVISDRLGRAGGMDAAATCRLPVIAGLVVAGISTIAAVYVADLSAALALMSLGLFAANVSSSCGWALAAVIAPVNTVATLEAIQNVGGSIGGSLAPLVSGILLDRSGSFVPAFVLAGGISIACAAIYGTMTLRKISVPIGADIAATTATPA
ncbi:MFS transporter [Hyphomicrobium sp.]|uniref:MFS transporter n=1 Tax=Hyphomicrobium sp. TaxID=82 RepID=UPI003569917A